MTKWAKANWFGAVVLSLAAAGETRKLAQGDPPRAFDAATAAVRAPGATVRLIEGGPVKIVLVGDSTVSAEGGWGKGFCAVMTPNVTRINEALNGRSSKSRPPVVKSSFLRG